MLEAVASDGLAVMQVLPRGVLPTFKDRSTLPDTAGLDNLMDSLPALKVVLLAGLICVLQAASVPVYGPMLRLESGMTVQ
jgi:hypothetical protein